RTLSLLAVIRGVSMNPPSIIRCCIVPPVLALGFVAVNGWHTPRLEATPSEQYFIKCFNGLQALADQDRLWFFIGVNWQIRVPPGLGSAPWEIATERHVVQFDGKACTSAIQLRSLEASSFSHPAVRVMMRFEDTFFIVTGVSGDGKNSFPGTAYRWDGREFAALDPKEAARVERACGLDYNKLEDFNRPRAEEQTRKSGWEHLLTLMPSD